MWSPRENDDYFGEPQEEDPDPPQPCVTGSPDAIWLVYGDLDESTTHAEEERHGEVYWCGDKQFQSDVLYVRAEIVLAAMPANWADDPDTAALARVLGLVTPNVHSSSAPENLPSK